MTTTCPTCKQRRDGSDSALKDWEYAWECGNRSMNRPDRYMKLAEREAEKSTHHKFPMGCVIIQNNKVIGRGRNCIKSHPIWGLNGWGMLHAETAAIASAKKFAKDISGSSIYIYRKGGKLARPCRRCNNALNKEGIIDIHYSGN